MGKEAQAQISILYRIFMYKLKKTQGPEHLEPEDWSNPHKILNVNDSSKLRRRGGPTQR